MSDKITVHCIPDLTTGTAQYIVHVNGSGIIIDPVLDFDLSSGVTSTKNMDKIKAYVKEKDLKITHIAETHCHADHITSASILRESFPGAKLFIGEGITKVQETFKPVFNLEGLKVDGSQFDILFKDGQTMELAPGLKVTAIYTPGHTADSTSFHIHDCGIFIGDTMFYPDKGTARCDFPNGSAQVLYQSIQKLLAFPEDTKLYLCHDYPGDKREFRYETTVKQQKEENIHLQPGADFVQLRTTRDETLKVPHLLFPSVQLNLEAGKMPAKESSGYSYLKIPINFFQPKI